MKTVRLNTIPKCAFCNKVAVYDAPTATGKWAYMCDKHFDLNAARSALSCGSKLVQRIQEESKDITVAGEVISEIEDIVVGDHIEIMCPECATIKRLGPDADGSYLCECGCTVEFTNPVY